MLIGIKPIESDIGRTKSSTRHYSKNCLYLQASDSDVGPKTEAFYTEAKSEKLTLLIVNSSSITINNAGTK